MNTFDQKLPMLAGVLSFSLGLFPAGAHAQEYIAKDLYVLTAPSGTFMSTGFGQVLIALGQTVQTDATAGAIAFLPPLGQVVELQPDGASGSAANATDGRQQVGVLVVGSSNHAALWTGTPESVVDLHPSLLTGFDSSVGFGIAPGQQVGEGIGPATGGINPHALFWKGTAESATDLNSSPYISSSAYGTDGQYQVGSGYADGHSHALLWNGTANSVIDLHPQSVGGFSDSGAFGVGGGQQVGFLSYGPLSEQHAAVWSGTADSAVDLRPSDSKTA